MAIPAMSTCLMTGLLLGAWAISPAGEAAPDLPSIKALHERAISKRDMRYDPVEHLIRSTGGGPGYHTQTKAGQPLHGTRDSADYAQLLLMRGQPEDRERAAAILDRLVGLQVADPASAHYGLWGWYMEEPPQQMAPADWNWADFIGVRLAEVLRNHSQGLDPALIARIRTALGHAAACIVKRDIGPGYTNICTMGAAVTLAAGGLLGDQRLLEYGRRRLAAQRADCEANGGVPEYNSPTYTVVMLHELERVLRLVDDSAARADAEWLRLRMWRLIAEQFHPGTGQWAGAQNRAYSDRIGPSQAVFLWMRTGVAPLGAAKMSFAPGPDDIQYDPAFACPPEVAQRFAALPSDPCEVEQVWMRNAKGEPKVVLRSWFSAESCLGSVNAETTWVQHRAVTGFWRNGDQAASVRLRFLKDGKDFASGMLRIQQHGPRLLAVMGMAAGQGDWHCSLDRPKDGTFTASDLRLRCELEAAGAALTGSADEGWILSAGGHRLAVHPGQAWFDGKPVAWEGGKHDGGVQVDAVLHHGDALRFSPTALDETMAGLALELLSAAQAPSVAPLLGEVDGANRRWTWEPAGAPVLAPRRLSP